MTGTVGPVPNLNPPRLVFDADTGRITGVKVIESPGALPALRGTIIIDGHAAEIRVGTTTLPGSQQQTSGRDGSVHVGDSSGRVVFSVDGKNATVVLGANGNAGDFVVRDGSGRVMFHVDGKNATLNVGAEANDGGIVLRDRTLRVVFHMDGKNATLNLGAEGNDGGIVVRDRALREVFRVDGEHAAMYIGANGNEGDIVVRDNAGRDVFQVDGQNAALYIGAKDNEGDIVVRDNAGNEAVKINGASGDIILLNADCAEEFEIASDQPIETGMVMVIGDDGLMRPCTQPYDHTVAGVISGAGTLRPGIVLGRQPGKHCMPIALSGKVCCLIDASQEAIRMGDLLTTCSTTGRAMKATDSGRAFGAVIGKALGSLREGRGLIPILVGLQ